VIGRLLHARRRRAARRELRKVGLPRAVLFVCHGNLCRSPYAAGAFLKLLPGELAKSTRVSSAGFLGSGIPAPSMAVTAAAARHVDLSSHRSRLLSTQRLDDADVIVVMEPKQAEAIQQRFGTPQRLMIVLADIDPAPAAPRVIRDPVHQPREAFDACYARIDRCLAAWVADMFGT
jgi:protein-tyrosine phosphatase